MAIFYKTDVLSLLKKAGYTTYRLRKEKLLSETTIQKLRDSVLPSWNELDRICELLDMQPGDILGYKSNHNSTEDDSHVEYVVHTTYERKGLHKVEFNEYVPVVRTEQQTSSENEATTNTETINEKVKSKEEQPIDIPEENTSASLEALTEQAEIQAKSIEDSLKELEALKAKCEQSLESLSEQLVKLIGAVMPDSSDGN